MIAGHCRDRDKNGVTTLSTNSPETSERGSTALQKKEERLREGQQAMAEYLADKHAMRERTAKLRALRLARDAGGQPITRPSRRRQRSALSTRSPSWRSIISSDAGWSLSVRPDAIAPPFRNRPVLCSDRRGARASGIAPGAVGQRCGSAATHRQNRG